MAEPVGFGEFVAACSPALVRSAWLLTGDEAEAHDLVQTALAKTWTRWSQVVRKDAPEAYVRKVMLSTLLTWRRRRWRGERAVEVLPERLDARDRFAEADLRHSVRAALQALPTAAGGRRAAVLRRPHRGADRRRTRLLGRDGEEPEREGGREAASLPSARGALARGGEP